jgi:YD repeat-containing protein
MKKLLTLSCTLFSFLAFAQYSPQEIKKFKISKLTKLTVAKGDESVQKNEIWYDEHGYDTAEYNGGELYRRTKYEYNAKGKPISRTRYGNDGQEAETATYTYNADGTCMISNTDKSFGMTDLVYCDKSGKTTRTVAPDRSERIYSYDAKGRLLKLKSKPADNGGVVVDVQYSYNSKGQLIKKVSKGDYKWTALYSYDAKGLITKERNNAVTDGVAEPETTTTYEYEFRK